MSPATPARSALARAAAIAPASRSAPRIGAGALGRAAASASVIRVCHRASSQRGQCRKAKSRRAPGGIRRASRAASIGMVPAPQKGSSSVLVRLPAACDQERGRERLAEWRLGGLQVGSRGGGAARPSCRDSPVHSSRKSRTTRSWPRRSSSSGAASATGVPDAPEAARIRSATARWWKRRDFRQVTRTASATPGTSQSRQGSAALFRSSSPSARAWKLPRRISTRVAVRSQRFARARSSSEPRNGTPPGSLPDGVRPSCSSSRRSATRAPAR